MRINQIMRFLLVLIVLSIGAGCGDDGDSPTTPAQDPALSISATSLDFGSTDDYKTFTITNSGEGTLEWAITFDENWLSASPTSGTTTTGSSVVTITVDRDGLSDGSYNGTITVDPNVGANKTVSVQMTVAPQPELSLSESSLDFGSTDNEKTFTITNSGVGTLEWAITVDENWLSASPTSGTTTTGSSVVTITVDRDGLSDGSYNGTITVDPNVGVNKTVSVQMTVPPPELSLSVSTLDFGSTDNEKTFTITNSGEGTLEWAITVDENWLSASPTSGTTTTGSSVITITVDRDGLSDGSYNGAITVDPNVGANKTVSVQMTVSPPELSLSVSTLDFGSTDEEKTFTITNNGAGRLTWTVTKDQDWLSVSPNSGETMSETDEVTVTVDRSGLSAGGFEAEISVSSNVGDATVSVDMSVGEQIWSYGFSTNTDLDLKWECSDENWVSGDDYWGITSTAHSGSAAVWCNGRGEHPEDRYDNNMDAQMHLKSDEAINISSFSDVTIRFWMKYRTESSLDYVRFKVRGNDDTWYYIEDRTQWSGDSYTWQQYEVNLSDFGNVAPTNFLRIGFFFNSDISDGFEGAFIDDIEIWGLP
ncbi:MAG: choice-of-anchor D domain-containing protein [Candidatus Hatepunaea meridiana]|nr:choice-of-anchor D domain-containing protein [Candidatus Hatepunaea meridiana]